MRNSEIWNILHDGTKGERGQLVLENQTKDYKFPFAFLLSENNKRKRKMKKRLQLLIAANRNIIDSNLPRKEYWQKYCMPKKKMTRLGT